MTVHVTVVGAGVIGLTVAVELVRAGHDVEVVAARVLDDTTSAIAGAIWFPYRVGPRERVARWGARTRARLLELADREPAAGVDRLIGYECGDEAEVPWWGEGAGVERAAAPVRGAPPAWRYTTPRVEPARFLPWLAAQLPRAVRVEAVGALADLPGDAIVHCAGLGARALADDPSVEALRGQVVVVEPGTIPLDLTLTDERGPEPLFYSIPRRDEVVLGGTSDPVDAGATVEPDPLVTDRILARCRAFGWEPGAIRRVQVGLRPYRPAVRLERDAADPRVIHCYGHGGAGYTLAFGCAEEVAALL
jgi:D-amino-acid oxidase